MELLLRAIFIILVETWQICDYLPNPYRCDMAFIEPMHRNKPNITYFPTPTPNVFNLSQFDTSNLFMKSPNIPKHNTYLSKQMPWVIIKNGKINIWGKIYIVTLYEMM